MKECFSKENCYSATWFVYGNDFPCFGNVFRCFGSVFLCLGNVFLCLGIDAGGFCVGVLRHFVRGFCKDLLCTDVLLCQHE